MGIEGAYLLTSSVFSDVRGSFEVFWEDCNSASLDFQITPESVNFSHNTAAGTVRAFHYQSDPHGQAKLVTCVSGRIWDVIVDLREDSPTYRLWDAAELSAGDGKSLYIPVGCAHGFAALENNSTVAYLIESPYVPEASSVIRWNDPTLNVPWPFENPILSEQDRNAPLLLN